MRVELSRRSEGRVIQEIWGELQSPRFQWKKNPVNVDVKTHTESYNNKNYNNNDWVGKVIHWELCKKFKFDYTNKWYMHFMESILEN